MEREFLRISSKSVNSLNFSFPKLVLLLSIHESIYNDKTNETGRSTKQSKEQVQEKGFFSKLCLCFSQESTQTRKKRGLKEKLSDFANIEEDDKSNSDYHSQVDIKPEKFKNSTYNKKNGKTRYHNDHEDKEYEHSEIFEEEEEEEESEEESYQPTPKIKNQKNKSRANGDMNLSESKPNNDYRTFKPFHSHLYEDFKINENDEYQKKEIIDHSVKGYRESGSSDESNDHFDPMQNITVKKPPSVYRQLPRKFESITSNTIIENKYKQIKDLSNRQGSFAENGEILRKKSSIDPNKSGVLCGSTAYINKIKESTRAIPRNGSMIYEESIDATKKDGWHIRIKNSNANESMAYGVGESFIKPHKLDESDAVFTLRRNNDFKKRIRKVDVERQQMELKKINKMQGQGATLQDNVNKSSINPTGMSLNTSEVPNAKAPGFDYYEVISEGSEDVADKNKTKALMKRRRSRTRDFEDGTKGTSYGNFIQDMEHEGEGDKIKPYLNLEASKDINMEKKIISSPIVQRDLPLQPMEKRDSELFNYTHIKMPVKSYNLNGSLEKSQMPGSNFISVNDQVIEERLACAAGDIIQEASILQENNSKYGRSSGMRDCDSVSGSGNNAGYSRRKMLLQRGMKRDNQ